MTPSSMVVPVDATVESRLDSDRAWRAHQVSRVLMSDVTYHRHAGLRRYFWLLDEGVQLVYEPFGWRDEWYVDVVRIDVRETSAGPAYSVVDQYIDIVVEGMGPTYRMLDLDELAEAMSAGRIDTPSATRALNFAQRFAEQYLHRGAPFPPPQIRPYFSADHHYPPIP